MKNYIKGSSALLLVFLCTSQAHANIDTRVGRGDQFQSFVFETQQPVGSVERFHGDIEFAQGITFTSAPGTGATFGVTPPVGGALRLASGVVGGQFLLEHDLILNVTSFEGANLLPSTFNAFAFTEAFDNPSPPPATIYLERDLFIDGGFQFALSASQADITLHGQGNKISISRLGLMTAFGVTIRNLIIEGIAFNPFVGSNLSISGGPGLTFRDVTLTTSENYDYTLFGSQLPEIQPRIFYQGYNNLIDGGGTLGFRSFPAGPSPIHFFVKLRPQTRLRVGPNTTLHLVNTGQDLNFNFTDRTSELFLDNCTLAIGTAAFYPEGSNFFQRTTHMTFTAGTLIVNGNVRLRAGLPGSSLKLGDGLNSANNCDLIILPGSKLIVDDDMTFINANV